MWPISTLLCRNWDHPHHRSGYGLLGSGAGTVQKLG
ncbi:hypothetical protein SAMN05421882_100787 [Nitrosomonas communis]|uniref:Uncharacterized protein n=1 Tax=Nitrosomonas communis TaxID=44574 RepID=A0A1H2SJ70_9PROT|nr:hypothetical protein SAMN05421882_100787 [Nitrosomonas communis]